MNRRVQRRRDLVGTAGLWAATAVVVLLLVPPGSAASLSPARLPPPLSTAGAPGPSAANSSDSRHWVPLDGNSAAISPAGGALAYDPSLGGLILFGGANATGTYLNGTWLYQSDRWTEICDGTSFNRSCPTAPAARSQALMAFDPAANELLMFGGYGLQGYSYLEFSDTWALRNTTWVRLLPDLVPGMVVDSLGGSMVYDPSGGYMFLNLPDQSYYTQAGTAFVFDNGTWAHATPVPGTGDVLFYDPAVGALRAASPTTSSPVFELGTAGWKISGWARSPVATEYPTLVAATFDLLSGQELAVVQSYNFTSDNYSLQTTCLALAGQNWTALDPKATGSPALDGAWPNTTTPGGFAYDPAIGAAVLPAVNWTWSAGIEVTVGGTTWALTDPLTATLTGSVAATDVGLGVEWTVGTSGGFEGAEASFNTPALSECSRSETSLTLDCSYSQSGTYGVSAVVTDGLGDSVTSSGQIDVHADPQAAGTTTEAATTVGSTVGFVGSWSYGTAPFTGTWSFGDGAQMEASDTNHSYSVPGTYSATWSVTDGVGQSSVRHMTVVVNPTLAIDAYVTHVVVDAGVADRFTGDLVGGTYPDQVTWTFGDGGEAAGPNVTHAYSQPGEYSADVVATDYVGVSALSKVYVEVATALVTAAGANETEVTAGSPVLLAAGAVGGAAPYWYWWTVGDGEWATAARFVHVFPLPGVYGVSVAVNDSAGGSELDQFVVDVTPAPSSGPPSGSPPPGSPGGVTGGSPPPSDFPRLTQQAGSQGPIPLGNAILIAGILAVLVVAVGSALDRDRPGRRRRPRRRA